MLGLALDSSRWESMLGREGEQMLLFGTGKKKITIGRQGGINTLRSGTTTAIFENLEPSGTDNFSMLTLEQSRTSGKNSEVPGKICSRLRQLADRSYVAGMILVLLKIFKHLVSSMPLLVSLLIVRLVLYSKSK
jgi:hypothetical protein